MIDVKQPIVTNDNRKVTIVSTNGVGDYPLIGFIGNNEKPTAWTLEGFVDKNNKLGSVTDIKNFKPKRKAYVNIYRKGGGNAYTSREKADAAITKGRVACLEIEYEDGDGLFDKFFKKTK